MKQSGKKRTVIVLAAAAVIVLLVGILAFRGIKADPQEQTVQQPEKKRESRVSVTVSDTDSLLAAIAPDTDIVLEPGIYCLTQASDYGKDYQTGYYTWFGTGFSGQYELRLQGVDNLTLSGEGAEIVTEPRMVKVLAFEKCDGLTLSGLRIGHTEQAEQCECGVLGFSACDNVTIESCSLYGCTEGINAADCAGLSVRRTDLHHCSYSGLVLYNSKDVTMDDCRIYNCGGSEMYGGTMSLFNLTNSFRVTVTNTEIFDNHTEALTLCYGSCEALFWKLWLHDNHIDRCFASPDGANLEQVRYEAIRMEGNTVNRWFDPYCESPFIMLDDTVTDEDALDALWGTELASAGIGEADAEPAEIDLTGVREIHVNTVDEFLAAISSDVHIIIDALKLDLMTASDYGAGEHAEYENEPDFKGESYTWMKVYDGFQLCIGDVSNLHISGGEIVTGPRYANVLAFYDCTGISLENVYAGHTPEKGECCGGVLCFERCSNVIVESANLYGCGILGITGNYVTDLTVQNTLIHDCSYGAVQLNNSEKVTFLNCSVVNCPEPHFTLYNCIDFNWDNKIMDPNSCFNVG